MNNLFLVQQVTRYLTIISKGIKIHFFFFSPCLQYKKRYELLDRNLWLWDMISEESEFVNFGKRWTVVPVDPWTYEEVVGVHLESCLYPDSYTFVYRILRYQKVSLTHPVEMEKRIPEKSVSNVGRRRPKVFKVSDFFFLYTKKFTLCVWE